MGANIEIQNQRLAHGEPVADFVVQSAELSGDIKLTGEVIANLIDEIPILAIVATQLSGTLTIYDAHELRVKESDRIRSIVDNLRRMKITIEEFDDGFFIEGKQKLRGATLDSYHDHRIAMAFAVAGLIADGVTTIIRADAASVSLPEFYGLLENLRN
jgi:3-phosphoshikimate 1-carboxyvinyltransferase